MLLLLSVLLACVCGTAAQLASEQHAALIQLYKGLKCDGSASCPLFDASAPCPSNSSVYLACVGANVSSIYVPDVVGAGASISSVVGQLSSLSVLTLYGAGLESSLPTQIGLLSSLVSLVLQATSLASSLPSEIGRCTRLTKLAIRESRLNGTVPTEVGNLAKLKQLWLDTNQLEGRMPTELLRIKTITQVQLEMNRLTGDVVVGLDWPLQTLDVADNDFSGTLPDMSLFQQLGVLHVTNNRLSGLLAVPEGLFECEAIAAGPTERNCFSQCAKACCPQEKCATGATSASAPATPSTTLSTTRAPDSLATSRTSGAKKSNNALPIGIGIGVGIVACVCVAVAAFLKCSGDKFQARNSRKGDMGVAFLDGDGDDEAPERN
jgi:hypothetical protein